MADFEVRRSFDEAFVYIPAGFRGNAERVAGTLTQLRAEKPEIFDSGDTLPLLVALPGSMDRRIERWIAANVCEQTGAALVGLNTHAVPGRPTYRSPAEPAIYARVHALRKAEIDKLIQELPSLGFVDRGALALVGVSEGAVAAACHPDPCFSLRVVISWSMEHGYFAEHPILGGDASTVFLNIVGGQDEYFGTDSALSGETPNYGHGARTLAARKGSKVVIFPEHGHRVLEESSLAINELTQFIRDWRCGVDNNIGRVKCATQ